MIDTGKGIRRAMGYKEVSCVKIAEALGVTKQTVYFWKKSKDLSVNKLNDVANVMEMSIIDLLEMCKD